jgi:sulfate permease, SulP family
VRVPRPPRFAGGLSIGGDGTHPRELFAGITLAALSLPLNIGYATAAGLPPTVGIYAALVPLVVFALTTGSRQLMVGPDATIAALLAAVVAPIVAAGAEPQEVAWAVALCVGLTMLAFWLFQLGRLVRFVSKAVLVGFIAGLGIEVLTSQVRSIMAVEVDAERWPREVVDLVRAVPDASLANVTVGVGTVVGLWVLRQLAPRLPAALAVLAVATVAVAVLAPGGVAVLGEIPSGLPRPTFPTLGLDIWIELVAVSLAIAVMNTTEGALIAQRYARRAGGQIDTNGEVFALGASNVAASVSGAMPVGASASRTAALAAVGSRTQVPSIVAAVVVAAVVLFFTDVVARLPQAALAGLVASAVISTIEVTELRRFAQLRRSELVIALICVGGVLLLGPIGGIVIAVLLSAVDVVRRIAAAPWVELGSEVADPALDRFRAAERAQSDDQSFRLVRPGGPLFFATADAVRDLLESSAGDRAVEWIVLDLEAVSDIDPTAAEAILEGVDAARHTDTVVAFTRVTRSVFELLERYGIIDAMGPDRIYDSNRAARAAYERTGGGP